MKALDAYNELLELKDDPIAFAKRQKEIMSDAIANCPKKYQKKLEQNNWCLEQELRHFKDPKARMNKMVEIFWKGVYEFEDALRTGSIKEEPHTKAKVVPFKKK